MFLAAIHVVSYSLHSVSRFVLSYFPPSPLFSAGLFLSISNVTVFRLLFVFVWYYLRYLLLVFYWARFVLGFHPDCGSDCTRAFLLCAE